MHKMLLVFFKVNLDISTTLGHVSDVFIHFITRHKITLYSAVDIITGNDYNAT